MASSPGSSLKRTGAAPQKSSGPTGAMTARSGFVWRIRPRTISFLYPPGLNGGWAAISSKVRGQINPHVWLAAIRAEGDHGRQPGRAAWVESPPAIHVVLQHGGMLLCHEWSLCVAALALVIGEPGCELRGHTRREDSCDMLRRGTIGQYTWPGLIIVLVGIPVYFLRSRRGSPAEQN